MIKSPPLEPLKPRISFILWNCVISFLGKFEEMITYLLPIYL
jgi:hypothetical protein